MILEPKRPLPPPTPLHTKACYLSLTSLPPPIPMREGKELSCAYTL